MRALIVDDEPAARRRLADLLEGLGVTIDGEASNGMEALTLARDRRPDVIFLDVSMPEVDGFDVARRLAEPRPLVIFQTAYAEFAVRAFDHDAVDYVVKPVARERLAQAVDRARRRLERAEDVPALSPDTLARFGAAIGHVAPASERLLVRHGAGHQLVFVRDIERFAAEEGLVYAHTAGATHGTDYTLLELEERFAAALVRASRSDLVSVAHVSGIRGNGDGSATLTLASGAEVHVSRRRAAEVRSVLQR